MPVDIHHNSEIMNLVAESEVASLLSNFNNNYIMDVVNDNVSRRFNHSVSISKPNIVGAFELNFKDITAAYPTDYDNVMMIREDTYRQVINSICNGFGGIMYVGDLDDSYQLAYNMYDIFVCNYSDSLVRFFTNYILTYYNELYDAMGLEQYKKSKDSTSLYMKKITDMTEVTVILSRIRDVIYYISGFDINIARFLSVCNYNQETINFIVNNIAETEPIFQREFQQVANDAALMTDIRISIQGVLHELMQQQQQTNQTMETEESETEDVVDQEYNQDPATNPTF